MGVLGCHPSTSCLGVEGSLKIRNGTRSKDTEGWTGYVSGSLGSGSTVVSTRLVSVKVDGNIHLYS